MKTLKEQTKDASAICFGIGITCIIIATMLSGCGQGPQGAQGPQGTSVVVTPSPVPDAVQTVVNGYNEYLVSQGSDPLTQGLRCTLYTVPNLPATPCLSASSIAGCSVISSSTGYAQVATFTYNGTIDQQNQPGTTGFNILPTALQGLYSQNFAVTCTGYFVNPDYNYHEFDTDSDDGSLLYISGSLVVQNDGLHGIADAKGEKYLQAQVYSFQLNYFQGPGNVALILNMDGNVLPAENLWH